MRGNAEAGRSESPSGPGGERRNKAGISDHERRDQQLRRAQDDAAFEAERGQLVVNKAHAVAFARDQVRGGCERVQTRALCKGRMITPGDAREAS